MANHIHGGLLKWIELHPGTASWVQAIGSVLAIIVAIWVASSQSRHAAAERKAERQRAENSLASLVRAAAKIVSKAASALTEHGIADGPELDRLVDDYLRNDYRPLQFDDLATVLLNLCADNKLAGSTEIIAVLVMRELLLDAKAIIETAKGLRQDRMSVPFQTLEPLQELAKESWGSFDLVDPRSREDWLSSLFL